MKTKVKQNQNILDLAVQHGGDISTAFELARKNNIEVDEWVQPGSEIDAPDVSNEDIKSSFEKMNSPASSTIAPGEVVTPIPPSFEFGATITLNGNPFIVAPNNEITDITLVNQDNEEVIPTEVTDSQITVEATASDPQYELVDFFTLNQNNPFGNTNRRTDEFGTQVYASGIIIDWFTQNQGTVLGYDKNYSTSGLAKAAAQSYVSSLTIGGFTGWRLPEWTEAILELYPLGTRMLNYPPINLADNSRFWTNTIVLGSTQSFLYAINVGTGISAISDTWPGGRAQGFRTFTMVELGL